MTIQEILTKVQKAVADNSTRLTEERINSRIAPMKGCNIITEQYCINKYLVEDAARAIMRLYTADSFYVYADPEELYLDYGVIDFDGTNFAYARYVNINTGLCSKAILSKLDDPDERDFQFLSLVTVLYGIGKLIRYKTLTDYIENISPELTLMMTLQFLGEASQVER